MESIRYYFALFISHILGNEYIVNFFRKRGMTIGKNTRIFSNINLSEPYLIEVGENCTIASGAKFITHDASVGVLCGRKNASDLVGKIVIGKNCFIGMDSLVLYGVTIPDNTIVAAGAVVTSSFSKSNCIIGGNPARIISNIADFEEKYKENYFALGGLSQMERKKAILCSKGKYVNRPVK